METVIVIGGGVSGLSAGIYAQRAGYRSIVCEKHGIMGGNLSAWDRGGYHIDNCVHWLTGTNKNSQLYRVWQDLGVIDGGGENLYDTPVLYSYEDEAGERMSLYNDLAKTRNEFYRFSVCDDKAISYFFDGVSIMQKFMGVGGEKNDQGYTFLQKAAKLPALYPYYKMSVKDLADKFSSRMIKGFLTSLLGGEFSSLALLAVFATFTAKNGQLIKGGSSEMAARLTQKYVDLGGKIYAKAEVASVDIKDGVAVSVTINDGEVIPCDAVIVTADPECVFGKILQAKMPYALARQYKSEKYSVFSAFQCAFSSDVPLPFCGDVIFDLKGAAKSVLCGDRMILREFSHEKGFAPQGKYIFQSMIFVNEDVARRFINQKADNSTYLAAKLYYARVVRSVIEQKYTFLKDKINLVDAWTPATYRKFTGAPTGAFMSFKFKKGALPMSAGVKIEGIKNVAYASQWSRAPGGLPTAALVGKEAALYIDRRLRSKKKAFVGVKREPVGV